MAEPSKMTTAQVVREILQAYAMAGNIPSTCVRSLLAKHANFSDASILREFTAIYQQTYETHEDPLVPAEAISR